MHEPIRRRGVLQFGAGAAIGGVSALAVNALAGESAASPTDSEPDTDYLAKDERGAICGPTGFPGPLNVSNDPDWTIASLPRPLGEFTAGLGSRFAGPAPSDDAAGGLVNTAVITQVEGNAEPQPQDKLFLDSLLIRLGLRTYDDSAVTSFAGATGVEVNLAVDGDGNNIQNLSGYYVVPILGQVDEGGVSGRIESLQMIRTDTIQGSANAAGLHIDKLIGIYASRPSKDTPNLTVGSQYSLVSEPGSLIYTDSAEDKAWLGIEDKNDPQNIIWLRISASGSLEFCEKNGSEIATLTNAGALTVQSLTAEKIAATDEIWHDVTSPPVSGTAYKNTSGAALELSANYTPGNGPGDVRIELSDDGTAWRTWLQQRFIESGAATQVTFRCPINWHYRITLTGGGAALGTLNALG